MAQQNNWWDFVTDCWVHNRITFWKWSLQIYTAIMVTIAVVIALILR